jgi:hypothetical protein
MHQIGGIKMTNQYRYSHLLLAIENNAKALPEIENAILQDYALKRFTYMHSWNSKFCTVFAISKEKADEEIYSTKKNPKYWGFFGSCLA